MRHKDLLGILMMAQLTADQVAAEEFARLAKPKPPKPYDAEAAARLRAERLERKKANWLKRQPKER